MHPLTRLIGYGLSQLVGETIGHSALQLAAFVKQHFTDHTQALPQALARANDRAWQALGIALAGNGFLDQVKIFFAGGDAKGVREQVSRFLESNAAHFGKAPADFRQACLAELKQAGKAGLLSAAELSAQDLAGQTADFRPLAEPEGLIEGAWQAVASTADELAPQCPNLARLLRQRPPAGPPLLVAAFAYFFRREVETNAELARGLVFDNLRLLSAHQAAAFEQVDNALAALGERFDQLMDQVLEQLGRIEAGVVQIEAGVVQVDAKLDAMRVEFIAEIREIATRNHVRPGDVSSRLVVSINSEREQALLKRVRDEYRQLPAEVQRADDLMLLADSLSAAGLFGLAREGHADAARAAAQARNQVQEAEAHFKAYRDACEQSQWAEALQALLRAAELAPARFAPFPLRRYQPQRILGAGGFGAVFHCLDMLSRRKEVAVKALYTADLARSIDEVFVEAQTLSELQHPALIGVRHWDYADDARTRPYIVMDYFPGASLQDYLDQHGVLLPADLLAVARQVAAGMQQAHQANVLHRDLKPENVLVRQTEAGWEVKIIDFGLAVRQQAVTTSVANPPGRRTSQEQSFAGTFKFAPPEQKGELPGVAVGPYSDVYTFGKTCCEALFQTTEPRTWDFAELPPDYQPLARLLERCIATPLKHRPADFAAVLKELEPVAQRDRAEDESRRRQEEATEQERQRLELARLQQEGEAKLTELLRAIFERTQGKPAKEDNAAAGDLCKRYRLPKDRATAIVNQFREQWRETRHAAEERQRQQEELARLQQKAAEQERQQQELARLQEEARLRAQQQRQQREQEEAARQQQERAQLQEQARLRAQQERKQREQEETAGQQKEWARRQEKARLRSAQKRKQIFIISGLSGGFLGLLFLIVSLSWPSPLEKTLPPPPEKGVKKPPEAEKPLPPPAANPAFTNSIGMKLVLIPPGKFMMGSPASDKERDSDEGPQHEVEITRPFHMGVYEVTQEEYQQVMGSNPSSFKGGRNPVETVTHNEAVEFCRKLSDMPKEKEAGRSYRLLTEAEWEYACRAGTTTPFHYGNSLSSKQANFNGHFPYGRAAKGPYLKRTTTVGSYQPNAFGLYDMHGNVWEWVADWYDAAYYKNSPRQDPENTKEASGRVLRGGDWFYNGRFCRSASRIRRAPGSQSPVLGFRVAAVQSR